MMKLKHGIIISLLLCISMPGRTEQGSKNADLTTPERALFTFLKASRAGATDMYLGALTEDSRKLLVSGAEQFGEDLAEVIQEDPFAKIEVIGSVQTEKRSAIMIKAHYKDSWFTMDDMNVTALSDDERASLKKPDIHGNNVMYHMPCAVQGVGYVAYLLVKEGSAWKVKKGFGYPIPLDLEEFMKE